MQKIYAERNKQFSSESESKGPKKKSIEFIKQFARIYSYKPMTQPELGSFVVN